MDSQRNFVERRFPPTEHRGRLRAQDDKRAGSVRCYCAGLARWGSDPVNARGIPGLLRFEWIFEGGRASSRVPAHADFDAEDATRPH